MKIYAILDHPGYNRTLPGVIEKWKEAGHVVKPDMYYDPEKAKWADVIFGEYIQGGVVHAVNDENRKTPIFIRGIDIDIYFGHFAGIDWDRCAGVFFINDYMKDYALDIYRRYQKEPKCPVEVVHLGVDMDKFIFKKKTPGKRIGWLNRLWTGKGIEFLLEIAYKMVQYDKEYTVEIVGDTNEKWVLKYINEFLSRNKLQDNVKHITGVDDVNEWMDNIDYILSTSMKECMSLPIAEGMAKGIKPVIHNWWGAETLYPGDLIFQTSEQACNIIMEDKYDSDFYRQYIQDRYTLDSQVKKLNKLMGIK